MSRKPGEVHVAFRVIAANQAPDHATIARFRARHEQALAGLFIDVLRLCAKAGLVSVGLIAVDGTLIAANASPAAARTHEAIREEVDRILGEAADIDAAEDERFGEARGDGLPVGLADRRSRLQRLRRCRQELEAEQQAAQAAYEENLRWRAEWEAEHGRKLGGRRPHAPDPAALANRKINTTDADSRFICRRGRTPMQGYNVQAVATAGQVIIAGEVTQQANDSGQLEPMVRAAAEQLQAARAARRARSPRAKERRLSALTHC